MADRLDELAAFFASASLSHPLDEAEDLLIG